jgi:hypothetical protein
MNGKRVKGLLAAWLVGKVVLLPIAPRQRPLLWLFEHSEGGSLVKRQNILPEMRLRRLVYFRADPPNPRRPTLAGSPRALPGRQPLRRLCHLRDLCYARDRCGSNRPPRRGRPFSLSSFAGAGPRRRPGRGALFPGVPILLFFS